MSAWWGPELPASWRNSLRASFLRAAARSAVNAKAQVCFLGILVQCSLALYTPHVAPKLPSTTLSQHKPAFPLSLLSLLHV